MADGRSLERGPVDPRAAAPGSWSTPVRRDDLVSTADEVLSGAGGSGPLILDSRPPEQYRGAFVWFEAGPIAADPHGIAHTPRGALRAGRVPWARSLPAARLYRPDQTLKGPDELRDVFAAAGATDLDERVIVYCGVGISASALAFGLTMAGYSNVAVYDGSWDEWGRDPTKPVARG
jgi:thiosulfate/3-mercaptopyruvate sulfurtransferase